MIPLTDVGWQSQSWQWLLSHAVTDINELVRLVDIPLPPGLPDPWADFPLVVPLPFIHRMQRGDPEDPLLLQVLPRPHEMVSPTGFSKDPLRETLNTTPRGLLHKYHGRVLVIVSGACAINCRYCFRRHFPYEDVQPDSNHWQEIFNYIRDNTSITEVILSGGDPLILSDKRLAYIARKLSSIGHVTTLRIHTRLPVVIPQRVCTALTDWMAESRLAIVVVLHCNHAREIDAAVAASASRLAAAGVTLLNQSVLLRGINDTADDLESLARKLFECRILPYYLHLLDPVEGAAHFDVPEPEAVVLMQQLSAALPGYLVPKLVREIPGEPAKAQRSWMT
ncbi:MAG: EF-P beta-lysylation protein EpmB [Pseudomonadales bacterium]